MTFEGVGLGSASDASGTGAGGRRTLGFDMKATGSYNSFRALFTTLESNTRLIDIDSIGISEDTRGLFSLSLKGRMYYAQ